MAELQTFTIESIGEKETGTSKTSGKPYTVHRLKLKDRTEKDGWVRVFWGQRPDPNAGDEVKGTIKPAKYGDGFELELERPGGGNAQRGSYGGGRPRDLGYDSRQAAWNVLSKLESGAEVAQIKDEKKFESEIVPILNQIQTDLLKHSDERITAAQRRKLFALLSEHVTPENMEQEVRDLDRSGKLTKKKASDYIEEVSALPKKSGENQNGTAG